MKHAAVNRWIFVGLLLAVIIGTMIGHAHAAPHAYFGAEPSHEVSWEDTPLALQQKLSEISKCKQASGTGDSAEAGVLSDLPLSGIRPLDIPSLPGVEGFGRCRRGFMPRCPRR